MTVYVKIKRLNGRKDLVDLAEKLEPKGFYDRVEYNEGGWADRVIHNVAAHLKFENEDDAIAYVLAHGGEISHTLPEMIPGVDFLPGG
jgi:hypothetical protein